MTAELETGTPKIPAGMPLTNRLDKMTTEQAKWAIRNGDAWIAYLREQRAAGVEVELLASESKTVEVSDADKYRAVCDVLCGVWLELTDNSREDLEIEQIPCWVELLHWAVKEIPVGYERERDRLQSELKRYLKGAKN